MTATAISTIRKIGLTLGLVLYMSTVVTSSSLAYSARARQMCMGDAFRLCSAEIPNISRIVACMRRNRANLSQGCRLVMDQEDTAATKTKPAQTGPVQQKPTTASRVEPPAATETKPVQAAPVERKPTNASPVEPAATETKPVQTAPVEQKPTTASPVEQPAASQAKPVQAAPVEQKPSTATPVEVKPVEAKSASRGRPAKLAQRKQKHRQLTVARNVHHEFRNVGRTIGFALPIPLVIQFYW
jgi:outer membrane biosynthesis protein TonB